MNFTIYWCLKGIAKRVSGSLANIFDGIQKKDLDKIQAQWGHTNQGADIQTEDGQTDGQSEEAEEEERKEDEEEDRSSCRSVSSQGEEGIQKVTIYIRSLLNLNKSIPVEC